MMQCRPGDRVCATVNYLRNLAFNQYCRRKSYSQISTDVALIVTNAAHLNRIIKNQNPHDDLRTVKIVLIVISIILEVAIGIMLFVKERWNIDDEKQHRFMTLMNDFVVYFIFASVLVHVFVSVFVEEQHLPPQAWARSYLNCSKT
ncbi:hypothetical protein JTE90_020046 [Oedothorax gibbosus]|uniref:Uncharacterized protein n=1 Tax=Oedothorax gibbosus TaxID=931172 RepID=A0AAV6UST9_9ARAC|nr:hypothetical protein JTE90_020046 [Oedothorax gibbosus]